MPIGEPVDFELYVPIKGDALVPNVESALARGLPELRQENPRGERLAIIANGPSARAFDPIAWDGATMAINGAIRLFGARGPDYWVAADPQPKLVHFLDDAPPRTRYVLASKVDPCVFDRLRLHDVIIWHLDEPAYWHIVEHREPVVSSVTTTPSAIEIGRRLGYSQIEMWGWDACYLDGLNHAAGDPRIPHAGAGNVDCDVAGERFRTTFSWMLEVEETMKRFDLLPDRYRPGLKLHGPGMMAAALRAKGLIDAA